MQILIRILNILYICYMLVSLCLQWTIKPINNPIGKYNGPLYSSAPKNPYFFTFSTENPTYASQSTPNTYYGQNNYNQYQAQMQGNYQMVPGQNWQQDPNNMTPQGK